MKTQSKPDVGCAQRRSLLQNENADVSERSILCQKELALTAQGENVGTPTLGTASFALTGFLHTAVYSGTLWGIRGSDELHLFGYRILGLSFGTNQSEF